MRQSRSTESDRLGFQCEGIEEHCRWLENARALVVTVGCCGESSDLLNRTVFHPGQVIGHASDGSETAGD